MSSTDTTRLDAQPQDSAPGGAPATGAAPQSPAADGSIWGAPPPVSGPATAEVMPGGGPAGKRRLPELVRTKVAALMAAAGLVVGGAAGVAVGQATGSSAQTPAGFTGQGGPGGGFGQQGQQGQQGQDGQQGGPGGGSQQGSGTQPGQSAQQGQSGTTQPGSTQPGTTT